LYEPIGDDGSLGIYGYNGLLELILIANNEAFDLTAGGNGLHLSTDVQQIVLDVFEHVDL
jgi:hypothetical protein